MTESDTSQKRGERGRGGKKGEIVGISLSLFEETKKMRLGR